MKEIRCNAKDLKRSLAFAMQVVARGNFIPVLGTVRIKASKGQVTITGTDLDIEASAVVDYAEMRGNLDITMNPKTLMALLRGAEGEIKISADGDMVTVSVDDVSAKFRSLIPAEDFPIMAGAAGDEMTIGAADLWKTLKSVTPCISTEETRYYLNGVFMHGKDGKLVAAATDGHRMAVYRTGLDWKFPNHIVPKKTINLLTGTIKRGDNGEIRMKSSPDPKNSDATLAPKHPACRIEFHGDGWKIISRTIDGTYPDYERVMPKGDAVITATLTAAALRRFPRTEMSRAVKIDPGTGRMSMMHPGEFEIDMPVTATGDKPLGFNVGYLQAFADIHGTIRIESPEASGPAMIITEDPNLTAVLMPMRT
jgi:DNA polymerase-3 subunit beta